MGSVTFPAFFCFGARNTDEYHVFHSRRWNPPRDSHHRGRAGVISARRRSFLSGKINSMITRKRYYRNSLDLKDKVQVKTLRRRFKLSDGQLATVVRKSGNSISAIAKEAATLR